MEQSNKLYLEILEDNDVDTQKRLCREDLFFLLAIAFKRKDINRPWLYDRVREVEAAPNNHLDLWFRDGYKSTIITYGKSIQDILIDPEIKIGLFSHTRPIAKAFLSQIKRELEENTYLKLLFPDILYFNPAKESPCWSLERGIVVKRKGNPKEATVEAWGLVDGQPISKHYDLQVYDDVVTQKSVYTVDQIKKTNQAWELSLNLSTENGVARYIGTRYHFNDTYKLIMQREAATKRIYPATHNGKMDGNSVLLEQKNLEKRRRSMGPYTFSCQMLQNPVADNKMGFKKEWLCFYDELKNIDSLNKYIVVDPAHSKKKNSDYTVMLCIGLAADNNYYLIDAVRGRFNLTERTRHLFDFVMKHRPIAVGYEQYGLQSDIEHIQYIMEQKNYRFKIIPLKGNTPKNDRILKLVPIYENFRFWLPHKLLFINEELKCVDFVIIFIDEEFLAFPVSQHDDILDAMARIIDVDLGCDFPKIIERLKPSYTLRKTEIHKAKTDYDLFS